MAEVVENSNQAVEVVLILLDTGTADSLLEVVEAG